MFMHAVDGALSTRVCAGNGLKGDCVRDGVAEAVRDPVAVMEDDVVADAVLEGVDEAVLVSEAVWPVDSVGVGVGVPVVVVVPVLREGGREVRRQRGSLVR